MILRTALRLLVAIAPVVGSGCASEPSPSTWPDAATTADAGQADARIEPPDAGHCANLDGVIIPVGVAYATGCDCCTCTPTGALCAIDASDCRDGGAPFVPSNPNWPVCTSTTDCEGYPCFFEPGCAQPQGRCATSRYCPFSSVSLCGCAGEALSGPTKPWSHTGECP